VGGDEIEHGENRDDRKDRAPRPSLGCERLPRRLERHTDHEHQEARQRGSEKPARRSLRAAHPADNALEGGCQDPRRCAVKQEHEEDDDLRPGDAQLGPAEADRKEPDDGRERRAEEHDRRRGGVERQPLVHGPAQRGATGDHDAEPVPARGGTVVVHVDHA
jgi:hypothetical protein